MKQLSEIENEIAALEKQAEVLIKDLSAKEYEKAIKRVGFLRNCKNYLTGEPRQAFIEKMRADLLYKKDKIADAFEAWKANQAPTPALTKTKTAAWEIYCRQMEMPHLNAQVKMLNFLLEK